MITGLSVSLSVVLLASVFGACGQSMEYPEYKARSKASQLEGLPANDAVVASSLVAWIERGADSDARAIRKMYPDVTVTMDKNDMISRVILSPGSVVGDLSFDISPDILKKRYGDACTLRTINGSPTPIDVLMVGKIFGEAIDGKVPDGVYVQCNLKTVMLFAYSAASDKPVGKMVFGRIGTADEARGSFLSRVDMPQVQTPFYLTAPKVVQVDDWFFYGMEYGKMSLTQEAIPIALAHVPLVSDGTGFCLEESGEWYDASRPLLPVSIYQSKDARTGFTVNLGQDQGSLCLLDYIKVTTTPAGIMMEKSVAGADPTGGWIVPVPEKLLIMQDSLSTVFAPLSQYEVEPGLQTDDGVDVRLKSLYGIDDSFDRMGIEAFYMDLCVLHFEKVASGGLLLKGVTPKYKEDSPENAMTVYVTDCAIGPVSINQSAGELAKFSLEELDGMAISFDRTGKYVSRITYSGSSADLATEKGLHIGDSAAKVRQLYGLPDLGIEGDAVWEYLMIDKSIIIGIAKPSDRMVIRFKQGRVSQVDVRVIR